MGNKNIDWEFYDQLLGYIPDGRIAKLAGCKRINVQKRRQRLRIYACRAFGENFWHELLGQFPDRTVAKVANISKTTVLRKRNELGIAPFRKVNWENYDYKLGKFSDKEIAHLACVSVSCIQKRRRKFGITPRSIKKFDHLFERLNNPEIAMYSGFPLWEVVLRRFELENGIDIDDK